MAVILYEDVFNTLVFLLAVWCGGKLSMACRLPSLVGEIIVGVLLGPGLADFVPFPYALRLYGELGLLFLVLEAGVEVDIEVLKDLGLLGLALGLSSALLPFVLATGMALLVLRYDVQASLAVGFSMAPTSMGVALTILKKAGMTNTFQGQLIIAGLIVDAVVALILLSQLENLKSPDVASVMIPIISSLGFLVGVGSAAILVTPRYFDWLRQKVPPEHEANVLLFLLFSSAIGLMAGTHYSKSHYLLGVFLAGFLFCTVERIQEIWRDQIKRVMQWLVRLFFASTIGFDVPIKDIFTSKVIVGGLVLMVSLLGKLSTGLLARPRTRSNIFMVGLSMAVWGEFGLIIAATSLDLELIDGDTFSIIVLATIISTIISPLLLSTLLRSVQAPLRGAASKGIEPGAPEALAENGDAAAISIAPDDQTDSELPLVVKKWPVYYAIRIRSSNRWGLLDAVMQRVYSLHLQTFASRIFNRGRGAQRGECALEFYCKDLIASSNDEDAVKQRMADVHVALVSMIEHDTVAVQGSAMVTEISDVPPDQGSDRGVLLSRWQPPGLTEANMPVTEKGMDAFAMEQSERLLAEDESVWEETGRLTIGGSERERLASMMRMRSMLKQKEQLALHLDHTNTVYESQDTPTADSRCAVFPCLASLSWRYRLWDLPSA